MANEDHLERLRQGADAWNAWRDEEPSVRPDLREADLDELDLTVKERELPHIGHLSDTTTLLTGGRRMATLHLSGRASELADARQIIADKIADNNLYTSLETPRLDIWSHFTRQVKQSTRALPPVNNWFADRFDGSWRSTHGDTLARNELFVSIILKPDAGLLNSMRWLGRADHAGLEAAAQSEFEDRHG